MRALEGKSIIVTVAGGGIGRETCFVLAEAGARVVASDVREIDGMETIRLVNERVERSARFMKADIAVEDDVRRLIDFTVETNGRLDGAFNNAGLEQCSLPLHELSLEQWDRALRVDLTSVFLCMKYQVIAMLKSGSGAIVNTASALGQVAIANGAEYVAAKHGVVGITRAAAADYGARSIRVNAILPGIVMTPMINRLVTDPTFVTFFDKVKERHPIGRFGQPREIGEAVKWLLSNAASFVNGAAISVDGGYLAV